MYLHDVGVKCPDCAIKFTTRQVPVYIDTGYRNSELRQHVGEIAPCYEHYSVCTCPSCGRADWAMSFEPTEEECVLSQAKTPPHLQYRNAAMRSEKDGASYYDAGMFYLYAAWCADDNGAFPQAKVYRKLAIDSFRRSLTDVSCPLENRGDIEYLIGELMRRIGLFDQCRAYFTQVIGHLPGNYATMARKLMRLAELQNAELIPFEV